MSNRRVVITGLGVISPLGLGWEVFWKSLLEGRSGVGPITAFDITDFPTKIAAQVNDFEPENYMPKKDVRRMDRTIQFAVGAASLALADSGLAVEQSDPDRIGVCIGSGIGGMDTWEAQHKAFLDKGPRRVSPFFIPMMIPNMPSGQVSIQFGLRGPNYSVVSACATGGNCIASAVDVIKADKADAMLAGGTEAAVTPLAVAGFCSMRAMSTRNDEPERASRPFDKGRDGFVMGEAAGVLLLEEREHALARGAKIYAEIVGYGATADAYHMTNPDPQGQGAARAMLMALKEAGLAPGQVDYINAHGTSTPVGDPCEVQAIKSVFGDHAYKVAVSSTKSMTGHTLGAAGAIETIVCTLAVQKDEIPPTINYEEPDPECDLDVVPNVPRKAPVGLALNNTFGFGGHNTVLALAKHD
ncbi:MAG: beta-ketoacyl-ACP synthase II [Vulcanimicrobiota bacterium]